MRYETIACTALRTALFIGMTAATVGATAGPLGYSLTGRTQYTAGCGTGSATVGTCGSPDTGWLSITNTGASAFVGTGTLSGTAPGQTIGISIIGTLNPGESWVFNAGPESSNQGGFNPQDGGLPNLGLLFSMTGTIDGGSFSDSIYDSEIHSGVLAVNPFGVELDNFVLQGGDPFGRDTGDTFEEAQAPGVFVWSARPDTDVPAPAVLSLLLAGGAAAGLLRRRTVHG